MLHWKCSNTQDEISWKWTNNGRFSVKSTYEHLTSDESGPSYSNIWKSKIPYKINIFLWLLEEDATHTKENMRKMNWVGDPTCRFCEAVETTYHLFFQCPTAQVVWGIIAMCLGADSAPNNIGQFWRWIAICLPNGKNFYTFGLAAICWAIRKAQNKACFEHKLIKHPAEIICHSCALMNFWTGLYRIDQQKQLEDAVKVLLTMVCRILTSNQRTPPAPLRLMPASEENNTQDDDE